MFIWGSVNVILGLFFGMAAIQKKKLMQILTFPNSFLVIEGALKPCCTGSCSLDVGSKIKETS